MKTFVAGYTYYRCEECGCTWREKSRDCRSLSSSDCPNETDSHLFKIGGPYKFEEHSEWKTDTSGNLIDRDGVQEIVQEFVIHELKIWPVYYEAVLNYTKRFEKREYKDRKFNVGDILHLREYKAEYTGRSLKTAILYKLEPPDCDFCILSISEPYDIRSKE